VFFVSPTAFNLLGIDRWVRNYFYVSYYDSFAGSHPRVFVPENRERRDFTSIEDICNHLLRDPEVRQWIASHRAGGKVAFVMFDEETESLAAELGLEVVHPSAALRGRLDSRSSRHNWVTRPACPASRTCSAGLRPTRSCSHSQPGKGSERPRRADPVRRLGQDDLFHRGRS
jgi:biotin carboxylase